MKSTHLIPRKTPVWLGAILIVLAGCIPEPDARLSALSLSYGALDPSFTANATEYSIEVPFLVTNLRVTPVSSAPGASIMVDGTPVASGTESQTLELAEGDTTIDIEVTAVDGVTTKTYAVTVTRHGVAQFAQQAYIKASNTDGGDWFGYSLALSGDTLAVGAPYEASGATGIDGNESDASAPDSGAVYVFVRSGGTWTQQAYVKASNPDPGDVFGMAVALHGDVLVVGAPGEASGVAGVNRGGENDNSLVDAGAAYVFVREGTAWTQQAYLKASNPGEEDTFGSTVAVMGDTIAVGVDGEDSASAGVNGNGADDSAQNAGAVYVFARDGAAWTQQAYIKASNAQALDAFGATVALSGEWMAVGAPANRAVQPESEAIKRMTALTAPVPCTSSSATGARGRSGRTSRPRTQRRTTTSGTESLCRATRWR